METLDYRQMQFRHILHEPWAGNFAVCRFTSKLVELRHFVELYSNLRDIAFARLAFAHKEGQANFTRVGL